MLLAGFGFLLVAGGLVIWLLFTQSGLDVSEDSESDQMRFSTKGTPGTLGKSSGLQRDDYSREIGALKDLMEDALDLEALKRLLEHPEAIPGEAIIKFSSDAAFEKFLKRAANETGLEIIAYLTRSRALRLGYDEFSDLRDLLSEMDRDQFAVSANYLVTIPDLPRPEEIPEQSLSSFGRNALAFLGAENPDPSWGRGVTIAVLDSGILSHPTFREGQVQNMSYEGQPDLSGTEGQGHGTAVASLISGNDPRAAGLAPGADILSYAVTGADGVGDSFSLASAIFAAADDGADIINISLGSYGNSAIVSEAVTYALDKDVLIVASAGNEGYDQLAYPAGYPGVVSVGAVDASSQHVNYSNTGDDLSLVAPGVGVLAAWLDNSVVQFSGTSASAPYVSGAAAAGMSLAPNLNPMEAATEVFRYTNEAGRPGMDPEFGSGILNLGRFVERDTRSIYDAAVASQTFESNLVSSPQHNPMLDVAIQNQGTETLYNLQVEITSAGTIHRHQISSLAPTEVAVRQVPVNTIKTQLDGAFQVSTEVTTPTMPVTDRNPHNNSKTTIIYFRDDQPGS